MKKPTTLIIIVMLLLMPVFALTSCDDNSTPPNPESEETTSIAASSPQELIIGTWSIVAPDMISTFTYFEDGTFEAREQITGFELISTGFWQIDENNLLSYEYLLVTGPDGPLDLAGLGLDDTFEFNWADSNANIRADEWHVNETHYYVASFRANRR